MRREFSKESYTSSETISNILLDAREAQHRRVSGMYTIETNEDKVLNPKKALMLLRPEGEAFRNEMHIYHDYEARARIHPALMSIRAFALEAIKLDPNMYAYLPEKLKNSPSFAKAIIDKHSFLYDAMPEQIRNNSQVKEAYIKTYLSQTQLMVIGDMHASWPKHSLCKSIDPHEIFTPEMYRATFAAALQQGVEYSTGKGDVLETFDNHDCLYPNDRFAFIHLAKALCPDMIETFVQIENEVLREKAHHIDRSLLDHAYRNECSEAIEHLLKTNFADHPEIIKHVDDVIHEGWENRASHVKGCHAAECHREDWSGEIWAGISDYDMRRIRQDGWVVSEAMRDSDLFAKHLGQNDERLQSALGGVYSANAARQMDDYFDELLSSHGDR